MRIQRMLTRRSFCGRNWVSDLVKMGFVKNLGQVWGKEKTHVRGEL